MNKVSYGKDHHAQAEREASYLVTFDFNGRYAKKGRLSLQGTMSPEDAQRLMKLVTDEFARRRKDRKKAGG